MFLFDLCRLLLTLVKLYECVIVVYCVFSMLYGFGVLDTRNRLVWQAGNVLSRLTEPVLNPIRNIMPAFGNIDLAPLIVLLVLQYLVTPLIVRTMMGSALTAW